MRKLVPAELTKGYKTAFDIDIAYCFYGIDEINQWKCIDSGLLFYTPVQCAGPAELYRKLRQHDWYYPSDKWEYDEALKCMPKGGRLLEVGSGDGHFLRKATRIGLSLEGLELTMPEVIQNEATSWSIIEKSVQDHAQENAGRYDVVCSFQVLEHVTDPRSFLEASVELLAPNGKLIISTPNADSFLRHAFNLLDMPPHHMSGWSEQSYRSLEGILPIKLEKVMYEPLAKVHADYFVDTYSSRFSGRYDLRGAWARGGIGKLTRKLLKNGMNKILRGQSMLVVFRKSSR